MNTQRTISAYSLVELLVSMAVIAILIVMLSSLLTNMIMAARKSLARSFVREEIAAIADSIASDISAANTLGACQKDQNNISSCTVRRVEGEFVWRICDPAATVKQVCKINAATGQIAFTSSPSVNITTFDLEESSGTQSAENEGVVLITLVGSHTNDALQVNNLIKQTAASTKNYLL